MGYREQVLADGPVGYWRLDDSGSTAVDQIAGANGTIIGGVTKLQPGALADGNPAMTFDGSTGKITTTVSGIALPVGFALEYWIQTTKAVIEPVMSNRPNGGVVFTGLDNTRKLFLNVSGAVNGNRVLNDGLWHHAVITNDGTTTIFYADGVVDRSVAQTLASQTARFWTFGQDAGDWWLGSLDELAIYAAVLSPTQIAQHYAAAAIGGGTSLSHFRYRYVES